MVGKTLSESCDGEGLAGGSADEDVDALRRVVDELGEVTMVGHLRVVMREDRAGERFDFSEPRRRPAEWVPSRGGGLDAGADGAVLHEATLRHDQQGTTSAGLPAHARSHSNHP
jgi:hypothetical protein